VRAWTEVALQDVGPPEKQPEPGSPVDVIDQLLFELREIARS
jgi:hypothetical protein